MQVLKTKYLLKIVAASCFAPMISEGMQWEVDSQRDWEATLVSRVGIDIVDGLLVPNTQQAHLKSQLMRFSEKRSAQSITITQSPVWHNWESANLTPVNLGDAPIALSFGPNDHWLFGRCWSLPAVKSFGAHYKNRHGVEDPKLAHVQFEDFVAVPAELDGFDVPLMTTPYPNQFDAPGGLKKSAGGYHAWQSRDLVNWVHHGAVSDRKASWATTAEQVDGKLYLYYDFPNDQNPHLIIDDDLTDGVPGANMGMAFKDPSNGSDCTFIRDLDGNFHVVYEDWSPIDASKHSWDSPLAGHAVSADGIGDFTILDPAVDERTNPTGEFAEHLHPHWHKDDPENYPGKVYTGEKRSHGINPGEMAAFARYEIHEPEQDAFGDWASICVGGQYYLFGDYHEAKKGIRLGWFTSPNIEEQFEFCGELGAGHPDPDVMFADGLFYIVSQIGDYVSPGPWVERVEARVGVDTNNDGTADHWSAWQEMQERYDYIDGFSKQIAKVPASLDLSTLPEGYGFQFELKIHDTTANASKPEIDKVTFTFSE